MSAFNQPLGGNEMPRFGGPATMMRLPAPIDASGLDACFVGIPMDVGTSNRSGTRFGPRQIRAESALIRPFNMGTGAAPFERMQVADIGDIATNPYDLKDSVRRIEAAYDGILSAGAVPLGMGGDHTMTYPILVAIARRYGPVALVHIDAHADSNDTMFGEKIAHGTPMRRAIEAGAIDCAHSYQIGLRGSGYAVADFDWVRQQGVTVIPAEQCWHLSLTPLMAEVRQRIGQRPVYLSFDIDSLDPAFAPGTGTPEIGGLTVWQALEIVRGCAGLALVGADLVEVSPPYDPSGNTALVAANLLFEMLCVLPAARTHA